MFKPGEIVIAAFPFTSLDAGKRRPCAVLAACDTPGDFLVAFITSVAANPAWRYSIRIDPTHPRWRQTGLKIASTVRVAKLTTLHASALSGAIGALPDDTLAAVRSELRTWLEL
jgi:mRNA interferase MazF